MTTPDPAAVPHTENYDEITKHLGHHVPCYGKPMGCIASEDANAQWCDAETGCIALEIYKRGYRQALIDGEELARRDK